jgi:hypothetical protein
MSDKQPSDFDFGILFGLIAGFTIAVLLGTFVEATLNNNSWINQYQTIIGSALAVVGAGFTIHMMKKQILQADRIHKERLWREANAARPLLTFDLVKLIDYAEDCAKALAEIYVGNPVVEFNKIKLPADLPRMPRFSNEIFDNIRNNLVVGEKDAVQALTKMLDHLQVQSSRLSAFLNGEKQNFINENELLLHLIDAIEVHAWCMMFLPYARGHDGFLIETMDQGHMISSAMLLFSFPSQSPLILMLLEKYPKSVI